MCQVWQGGWFRYIEVSCQRGLVTSLGKPAIPSRGASHNFFSAPVEFSFCAARSATTQDRATGGMLSVQLQARGVGLAPRVANRCAKVPWAAFSRKTCRRPFVPEAPAASSGVFARWVGLCRVCLPALMDARASILWEVQSEVNSNYLIMSLLNALRLTSDWGTEDPSVVRYSGCWVIGGGAQGSQEAAAGASARRLLQRGQVGLLQQRNMESMSILSPHEAHSPRLCAMPSKFKVPRAPGRSYQE